MQKLLKNHQLLYYEVFAKRIDYMRENERRSLYASQVGFEGESESLAIYLKYIPRNWRILTDLNFIYEGQWIQIDALLITPHWIIILEVKNLKAYYTYENGDWSQNGQRLKRCYFDQLKRTNDIFRNVMEAHGVQLNTLRKLVLINEHKTVTFKSQENQQFVLERSEIKRFIDQLQIQGKDKPPVWDIDQMEKFILGAQSPAEKQEYINLEGRHLKKGIICSNQLCEKSMVSLHSRYHVRCKNCGYIEPKRTAVARTICEYSILFPDKKPTAHELLDFLGNKSLRKTLYRVLHEDFQSESKGRSRRYNLPADSYDNVFPNKRRRHREYQMVNGKLNKI